MFAWFVIMLYLFSASYRICEVFDTNEYVGLAISTALFVSTVSLITLLHTIIKDIIEINKVQKILKIHNIELGKPYGKH